MTAPALRRAALVLAAATLLSAAGCGGDGDGPESSGTAELTVGVLPISDVAPVYLGDSKGFFRDEQIELEHQVMQGGAEVTAAVVSGDVDLGFSATEPLIVAKSKNLPVEIVTQGNQAAATEEDAWDGLLVPADSPIREPAGLEGKTVAVNALKSMPELCVRAVLSREGVDVSKLKFVEVPFPEMTAALEAGRVDAVAAVEPFVSQARAGGARSLGSYLTGLQPKLTVATYFAASPFIAENEDVVKRFARAMNRSLDYAQEHPEEARKAVVAYTEIPRPIARVMKLPLWSSDLNPDSIELIAQESERHGFVEEKPSIDELIWDGAE
ncbi:MAG: NitT/TauT family transport system substrate-binding protein [Thermoleophilaceae bacterium]|jgi:NitT/TauT family transport system substrate-binding protein|nr:NitT/TauT family transport system substrate-binding protein [Thermoleophilaceae bacterium]